MATRVPQRFIRGAIAASANRVHVQLRDLPRTVIPADLRRVCAHAKLNMVTKFELDYGNFEPKGVAYLTLDSPMSMPRALYALNASTVSGFRVYANSSPPPLSFKRTRGVAGRQEAADRGILTGDGPSGGIIANGQTVVVTGLPGRMSSEGLKHWLRNFKLAGDSGETKEITKIEPPQRVFSFVSKHLIRLSSVSEAHRMVRKLHHTYYEPDVHDMRYPIRARIIY